MKNTLLFIFILILNSSNAQVSDFEYINFTKADNIAKLQEGASLNNLPLLAYNLTKNLDTDVEKFRAIYIWVSNNIKGDSKQTRRVLSKRKKFQNDSLAYIKWNDTYKISAFKKLIKYKKTMCTGYAYLIKELCFLANIESEIINGYGRSVAANVEELELANHSWNAVKLNNKWYLCDATWSSGYMLTDSFFVPDYNDGYFLTDPVLFAKNHYPIQKKWLLDSSLINSEFIASPLVYSETFKHKIIPISPVKMYLKKEKNETIHFSFKTLKNVSLDKISLIQYAGYQEKTFKIYNLKNENGLLTFQSNLNQNGLYDVHLKIEEDIVATYTIKVIKS